MKKLSLFLALFSFSIFVFSQTLNESFDGTTFPPTGWQNIQVSGSGLWKRATAGVDPACAPHSGAAMAWYNSYDYAVNVNALLVSPTLTFNGTTPHIFSFWKYNDSGWNIYPDSIGVYYNSTPSLTGATLLASLPRFNSIDGWFKYSYLLPASLTGTKYIIFRGYSQYGNNMYIDDIELSPPPADDISTLLINNNMYLANTSPIIPSAIIKNTGINTESGFDVICKIYNYSNTEIYSNTQTVSSLALWDTTTINFAPFTLPNAEAIYKIKVFSSLTGDLVNSNDTIEKTVYTYTHNKQSVLLEIGTGTWCTYCPGAAMGADDLVTNGKNVAVVENHNGDTYAYTSSDARNSYYGINSFPTAVFDGVKSLSGGDHSISLYTSYLPIYDVRYAIKTVFGITINGTVNNNIYNLSAIVDRYGETPFSNSNLVLHVALTQSHITQSWQGQTHLEYVSRIMTPDATGTPIDLSTATQVSVPLTFNFNTIWGGSIANHDFELVAWVQDLDTKEVVDATKIDLASILLNVDENNINSEINIFPNPTKDYITVVLKNDIQQNITICDIKGQELINKKITSKINEIDISNLASGIYYIKITNNKTVEVRKIIKE